MPSDSESPLLCVQGLRVGQLRAGTIRWLTDPLSFAIKHGAACAIVGESGSGKTLSMLALTRLLPSAQGWSYKGAALFEGDDLLRCSDLVMRQLRWKKIAYLFQEAQSALNPSLKIGYQLQEALLLGEEPPSSRSTARQQAERWLQAVGLMQADALLEAYPHQLSGGMCQRVCLAMALGSGARLLILDEPTSALDTHLKGDIIHLLQHQRAVKGTAMLVVTHDWEVAASLCDYIIVMYGGTIVEEGLTAAVCAAPRHPYTIALQRSIAPKEGWPRDVPLPTIEGQPYCLWERSVAGCPFTARCPQARDGCGDGVIPLRGTPSSHSWRCVVEEAHG